jgi:hypothetical protein
MIRIALLTIPVGCLLMCGLQCGQNERGKAITIKCLQIKRHL